MLNHRCRHSIARSRSSSRSPACLLQPRHSRRGVSLAEVLVVAGVISILISLLIPAVVRVRESARRTTCRNNLRQIGLALQLHEGQFTRLPSNGWGHLWIGDATRGFGPEQPGGWIFNIIPYLEANQIREMGTGATPEIAKKRRAEMNMQPVNTFLCPSRPRPAVSAETTVLMKNAGNAGTVAKTDYAINEGSVKLTRGTFAGPDSLSQGDDPTYQWPKPTEARHFSNGITFLRAGVRLSEITDGLTETIAVGEKYMNTADYDPENADKSGNNQSMYTGRCFDTTRWTAEPPLPDSQDRGSFTFGSAHRDICFFLMCDGRVIGLDFLIDRRVYRRMGSRNDGGEVIDGPLLDPDGNELIPRNLNSPAVLAVQPQP